MAILVTGGAGYIGSVTVEALRKRGVEVIVIDNLVYGHRDNLSDDVHFFNGDIGDKFFVNKVLEGFEVSACMHFSAFAYVGESVDIPSKYYQNNVAQTLNLLEVLLEKNVKNIVFSSTCATYGEPEYFPIDEEMQQSPENPYGWSKFFVERILEDYSKAFGIEFVALRYFNAAGATEKHGERHDPETHLIPLILQAASGERDSISIYGGDYPTPDGTAIRDYIHVSDLADAHLLALDYLEKGKPSDFFNLGNGDGHSVLEIIAAAERVTGKEIKRVLNERRPGDPAKLVATAEKAKRILGWNPQLGNIDDIISSAWNWKIENS